MATILSSKSFTVPEGAYMPRNEIEEWFYGIDRGTGDLRLTVTLETCGDTRKKKLTAKAELESMAIDAALENKDVWASGKYRFCFVSKQYFWKKQEIYLTANEQLFLFRWLVLKDEISKRQTFYLRNMRRRLGKEFLTGLEKVRKNDNA